MDESLYEDRTPLWAKIPLVKRNLKNYDWVMWIDSDAMPINFNYRAVDFIDENFSLIVGEELLREGPTINTGIFFIKNTEKMHDLLDSIWEQKEYSHDCWAEQRSLIELLKKDESLNKFIKKIPMNPINVHPNKINEETFITHIAGGPSNPEYKANLMTKVLNDISVF